MAVVNRNGRATKISSGSKSCYTGIYNHNIRVLSFLLGLWISQSRDRTWHFMNVLSSP